eukprot:scaffold95784_cov56-Phaeocystis_antarctica.AAC.2
MLPAPAASTRGIRDRAYSVQQRYPPLTYTNDEAVRPRPVRHDCVRRYLQRQAPRLHELGPG